MLISMYVLSWIWRYNLDKSIKKMAKNKPIILASGASSMKDVKRAVTSIKKLTRGFV